MFEWVGERDVPLHVRANNYERIIIHSENW